MSKFEHLPSHLPSRDLMVYERFYVEDENDPLYTEWYIASFDKDSSEFFCFEAIRWDVELSGWNYVPARKLLRLYDDTTRVLRDLDWKPKKVYEVRELRDMFRWNNSSG